MIRIDDEEHPVTEIRATGDGPNFAEGAAITDKFGQLAKANQNPTKIGAEELPIIRIVDEDGATKTFGREAVFRDMLRIIHGAVNCKLQLYLYVLTSLRSISRSRSIPTTWPF